MAATKVASMVAVKAEQMAKMVKMMAALSVHMRVEMTDYWTVYRMAAKKVASMVAVKAEQMVKMVKMMAVSKVASTVAMKVF